MPELTEAEYAELTGAKNLLDKLTRDPRTKRVQEGLIKVHHPEVLTFADTIKEERDEIEKVRKDLEDFKNSAKTREIDERLDREYNELRARDWTDEGIEKLKKFQIERQIASPLDAAAAWDRKYPKPKEQVSPIVPTDWGFGPGEKGSDTALLFEDPDRWTEIEANKAWNDAMREKIGS